MRKLCYFSALVVAMTAVSCVEDINDGAPVVSGNYAKTFTATFDAAASKAVLLPGETESKVEWEAGDQVSVLAGEANYLYAAASAGATTELLTEATDVPAEGDFYAVYPYDADATLAEGVITTTLPAEQTAVKGSFSTHLAVAKAAENNFAFKNVCGLVKVSVEADGVTKIVLQGNSDEDVAGAINVTVSDAPAWTVVEGQGSKTVALVASTTLEQGNYYFAVLPQTFAAGFKVTAYKGEESWVIRNVTASTTIERADIVGSKAFFEIEGNGTEANPYILKTPEHLLNMRTLATSCSKTWFEMANDIDMEGVEGYVSLNNVNSGDEHSFDKEIHFDGKNYTISNLSCSTGNYPSVFGVLWGTCQNLKVTNAKITSKKQVAGILGGYVGTDNKPAVVTNVSVQGTVTSSNERCGGFAGHVKDAIFTDCNADVVIQGTSDVGGFAGKIMGESSFTRCEVKSELSSTLASKNRVGGFAGWVAGTTVTFTDCKVLSGSKITDATGNTAAYNGMYGGFVAYAGCSEKAVFDGCDVDTDINLPWVQNIGGIVGIVGSGALEVDECYVAGKIVGNNQIGGVLGFLETGTTLSISNTGVTATITGGTTSGAHFCAGLVGRVNEDKDGEGKGAEIVTITDSYSTGDIASGGSSNAGLVGAVQTGTFTIQRCYATGSVSGNNNVGGLVGNFHVDGTMTDCYYIGAKVKGNGPGGLIGSCSASTITNCYAHTNVEGNGSATGGLVASLSKSSTLTKCHFSGNITTSNAGSVGGLIGLATSGSATIDKCYTTGKIELAVNKNNIGGLLGYAQAFAMTNSWSSMDVISKGQATGGLVGQMSAPSTITNCFSIGNVTGRASTGGLAGMSYNNADGNVVQNSIAWGNVTNTKTSVTQYCAGAVIGCVHTKTVTAQNCWRNPDMILTDFVGAYNSDYNYNNVLVDNDDVINGIPPIIVGLADDVTNAFAQRPYHGKAAAAGSTISSVAKTLGWDENVWDLSNDIPVLK